MRYEWQIFNKIFRFLFWWKFPAYQVFTFRFFSVSPIFTLVTLVFSHSHVPYAMNPPRHEILFWFMCKNTAYFSLSRNINKSKVTPDLSTDDPNYTALIFFLLGIKSFYFLVYLWNIPADSISSFFRKNKPTLSFISNHLVEITNISCINAVFLNIHKSI